LLSFNAGKCIAQSLIVNVYAPASGCKDNSIFFERLTKKIVKILESEKQNGRNVYVLMGGDMNATLPSQKTLAQDNTLE